MINTLSTKNIKVARNVHLNENSFPFLVKNSEQKQQIFDENLNQMTNEMTQCSVNMNQIMLNVNYKNLNELIKVYLLIDLVDSINTLSKVILENEKIHSFLPNQAMNSQNSI